MNRRTWLMAQTLGFAAWRAQAESFPSRSLTIVVPQQAGSYSDSVIRPIALGMQEPLGQAIVIDNRPGANGIIGVEAVQRAKPDGYTLLLSASSVFVSNSGMYRKLSYDPVKDFRSVARLSKVSMMLVARADAPTRTLDDVLTRARRADRAVDVAVGSSTAQLALALLSSVSGLKFNVIQYKGSPQVTTDLLAGVVPLAVNDVASGAAMVKANRLLALATTDSERAPFLADVPTLAERFPGATLVSWTGLSVPSGTPDPIVQILYAAVRKAMDRPELQRRLSAAAIVPTLDSPEGLDRTVKEDIPRWTSLMRAAGMEPQ